MSHFPSSLAAINAIMAFSAMFAAGIMYRRTRNWGWLLFIVWVLLATSHVFEQLVDPFNSGVRPANAVPTWRQSWWIFRPYLDRLTLAISVLAIAIDPNKNSESTEISNYLRLVIGWIVPAVMVGVACTVALPYLIFIAIGGTHTSGFAAAGGGWFALLGGYIVTIIYIYLSLPGFALSIISYGDEDSKTYMKKAAIVQVLTYFVAACLFAGYIAIIKAMKS